MNRIILASRIILPTVIVGMIVAISFIEAPLKFQAPGITIPLGLGIGRLVFAALNSATGVLLILLTLASVRGPKLGTGSRNALIGIWLIFALQIFAIRPSLNARTDAVIAGSAEPGSIFHYLYIAGDLLVLGLLIAFATMQVKQIISNSTAK